MKKEKTAKAKAPSAKIIRNEDEEAFLQEVNEYFEKGYRPIQEIATFAALDTKTGKWRTLYVMMLVHSGEMKEFQSVPISEGREEERMFG